MYRPVDSHMCESKGARMRAPGQAACGLAFSAQSFTEHAAWSPNSGASPLAPRRSSQL